MGERRLVELTDGFYSKGDSQGLPGWLKFPPCPWDTRATISFPIKTLLSKKLSNFQYNLYSQNSTVGQTRIPTISFQQKTCSQIGLDRKRKSERLNGTVPLSLSCFLLAVLPVFLYVSSWSLSSCELVCDLLTTGCFKGNQKHITRRVSQSQSWRALLGAHLSYSVSDICQSFLSLVR